MAIPATTLECDNCYHTPEELNGKLYYCQYPDCPHFDKRLCVKCGQQGHSNKRRFKHNFNIDEIHIKEVQSAINNQLASGKAFMVQQTNTSNTNHAIKRVANYGGIAVNKAILIFSTSKALLVKKGVTDIGFKQIAAQSKNLTFTNYGLKKLAKQTAAVQALFYVWEIGCEVKRFNDGVITGKQLMRLCLKATTAHAAAIGGGVAGATFGAAVGNAPGFVIGGFIGGLIGDIGSRYLFDRFIYDDKKQKQQEEDIKEALLYFSYVGGINDIWFNDEFNEKLIKSTYHDRALRAHPDRPNGSHDKFSKVVKYYNILLGLLKEKDKRNKNKNKNKDQ